MLKAMIEKIEQMAATTFTTVGGYTYTSKPVHMVTPYEPLPETLRLTSLDGVVQNVKNEAERFQRYLPMFVQAAMPTGVNVFTSFSGEQMKRALIYTATPGDIPGFQDGYRDYETAMIELRSKFAPSEDIEYLLGLLSRITDENSVTTEDNGVTQAVQVNKGVALKGRETIRPIVRLRPYRTFYEVDQPESEFLVRVADGGRIGLFEADGGAWKMVARKRIRDYFDYELADLIADGKVVATL